MFEGGGRDNGINAPELAAALCTSKRNVGQTVHDLREAGALIGSDTTTGYWILDSRDELEHLVRSMKSRICQIQKATTNAERLLKSLPPDGQITL